jgi:hypothetical protein
MNLNWKENIRRVVACGLVVMFVVPSALVAQTHVVSNAELQKEMAAVSQSRKANLQEVQSFLSSEAARKAMRSAHVDEQQVKKAVASMSDAELANLASRTRKAQADFAAGTLSDRDLIVVILALLALILIIVAVR